MILFIPLAVIGLVLIYFEFFLPGGLVGILGGLLLIGSAFVFAMEYGGAMWTTIYVFVLIALLVFTIKFALFRIKHTKTKNTLYSNQDQEGFFASSFHEDLIGKEGIAASNLNPSGHIWVDDKRHQAVSNGSFVKKGEKVKIIRGQGSYYVVNKIKGE